MGKVQADSNTEIFPSDSLILNVYRGRTERACQMQFLLLSVKRHLPPVITVLNLHTSVDARPQIPTEGTLETARVREN